MKLNAPADDRGGAGFRVRQCAPIQRGPSGSSSAGRRPRCGARGPPPLPHSGRHRGSQPPAALPAAAADWPSILSFLRLRAIAGIETGVGPSSYARTIEIDGAHGIVAVRPADGNALRATIRFTRLSALPTIIARLRRVFDLAADPQTIGAHLAEDLARWRHLWRPVPACAYRVAGTVLRSPSAPCSASRYPWSPPAAWPASWSPGSARSWQWTTCRASRP